MAPIVAIFSSFLMQLFVFARLLLFKRSDEKKARLERPAVEALDSRMGRREKRGCVERASMCACVVRAREGEWPMILSRATRPVVLYKCVFRGGFCTVKPVRAPSVFMLCHPLPGGSHNREGKE